MPLRVLLLLLLFAAPPALAQLKGKARADSLIAALPRLPEDTTRHAALYAISKTCYEAGDAETGLRYARQDSALCVRLGHRKGLANAYNQIGNHLSNKRDYEQALEAYRKGLGISEAVADTPAIMRIVLNLALTQERLGQYPVAREWYGKRLALAEALHDDTTKAGSLSAIGVTHARAGDAAAALGYYEQALGILRGMARPAVAIMAKIRSNVAMAYNARRDYAKALETYGQLLDYYEKAGQKSGAANVYLNMSAVFNDKGDYAKGLESAEKAQALALAAGDSNIAIKAGLNAANVYTAQGSYERALQIYREGLRFFERQKQLSEQASTLAFISKVYGQQGKQEARIQVLLQAKAIQERLGNKAVVAMMLTEIGNSYSALEDRAKIKAYNDSALAIARQSGDRAVIIGVMNNMGVAYRNMGDYPRALELYLEVLKLADTAKDKNIIARAAHNVGSLYDRQGDRARAIAYTEQSLGTSTAINDKGMSATNFRQLAEFYARGGDTVKALAATLKALALSESINDYAGIAWAYSSMHFRYRERRQYDSAMYSLNCNIALQRQLKQRSGIAFALENIGYVHYLTAKDSTWEPPAGSPLAMTRAELLTIATDSMHEAEKIFRAQANASRLKNLLEGISIVQAYAGNYKDALAAYKEHITLRDSLETKDKDKAFIQTDMRYAFTKTQDSLKAESEKRELALQTEAHLAALRTEYQRKQAAAKSSTERTKLQAEEELKRRQIIDEHNYTAAYLESKRQREAALAKAEEEKRAALAATELRRQKAIVTASVAGGVLLLGAAIAVMLAYRQKRRDAASIAREQSRSESLLLNILPAEVAQELKARGDAAAKHYDEVSVLFTDFVDTRGIGKSLAPQALVQELHECFTAFDGIMEESGLEKIKTIGNSYLAVSGLPQRNARHAQAAVSAALAMLQFMHERKERLFELRIGINSGPLVAGIVGVKKFAYDIWGDTVNTAARMEQHGAPSRINISRSTHELIMRDYPASYRGKVAAKNKGEVEMYFVDAIVQVEALNAGARLQYSIR